MAGAPIIGVLGRKLGLHISAFSKRFTLAHNSNWSSEAILPVSAPSTGLLSLVIMSEDDTAHEVADGPDGIAILLRLKPSFNR